MKLSLKKKLFFTSISLHFLFHFPLSLSLPLSSSLFSLSSCLFSLSSSLFSLLSSLLLSGLSVCLRVMLCVVLCGCVSLWSCVCLCVLRHDEKMWKKNECGFKNASVCTFKTSTCMPAPRVHVFRHVRVVPVHTGTFRMDTRGAGGHRQFCLPKFAHVGSSLGRRFLKSFSFSNPEEHCGGNQL